MKTTQGYNQEHSPYHHHYLNPYHAQHPYYHHYPLHHHQTWLDESNVKDLVNLAVVGSDVEDQLKILHGWIYQMKIS